MQSQARACHASARAQHTGTSRRSCRALVRRPALALRPRTRMVTIWKVTAPHTSTPAANGTDTASATLATVASSTPAASSAPTRMRPPSSGYAGTSRLNAKRNTFICKHGSMPSRWDIGRQAVGLTEDGARQMGYRQTSCWSHRGRGQADGISSDKLLSSQRTGPGIWNIVRQAVGLTEDGAPQMGYRQTSFGFTGNIFKQTA
eukprot:352374-Chlamydomonas_euryale.AAC.5